MLDAMVYDMKSMKLPIWQDDRGCQILEFKRAMSMLGRTMPIA